MNLRLIVHRDAKPRISISHHVRQAIREQQAAEHIDALIGAAFDGEIDLGQLREALAYAERKAGPWR